MIRFVCGEPFKRIMTKCMHRNMISSEHKEGNESDGKCLTHFNILCMVIVSWDVFHYDEIREIEMFVLLFFMKR